MYYSIKAAEGQEICDILCFAQSDIMPYGIVIFLLSQKWYYIRHQTAQRAISLRRSLNNTAKQYNSPKANITKKLLFFRTRVFLAPLVGLEPTTCGLTVRRSTDWAKEEYLCWHYLSSRAVARQVLSAHTSLTSVFGMGTGGPSQQSIPTHMDGCYTIFYYQKPVGF